MTTTSTKTRTTAKKTPTWNSTYAAAATSSPRINHSRTVTHPDLLVGGAPPGGWHALASAWWLSFLISPVPSLAGQEMVAATTDSPCPFSLVASTVRPSAEKIAR